MCVHKHSAVLVSRVRDIKENGLMADYIPAQFTMLLVWSPESNTNVRLRRNVHKSTWLTHRLQWCMTKASAPHCSLEKASLTFFVFKTKCNVPHSVAVVCQHDNVSFVFSNNMSDIKLALVDGFHSIQVFASCDPGWFKVDDVCINCYLCQDCVKTACTEHHVASHEKCQKHGGHLAYHLLQNITFSTPGNILDKKYKTVIILEYVSSYGAHGLLTWGSNQILGKMVGS